MGGGFPGGSAVKNLPAMQEPQETRVRSPGREDPLKESVATPFSILARKISWTQEPGCLQSRDFEESDTMTRAHTVWGHGAKSPRAHGKLSMFSANGRSILTFGGILFGR